MCDCCDCADEDGRVAQTGGGLDAATAGGRCAHGQMGATRLTVAEPWSARNASEHAATLAAAAATVRAARNGSVLVARRMHADLRAMSAQLQQRPSGYHEYQQMQQLAAHFGVLRAAMHFGFAPPRVASPTGAPLSAARPASPPPQPRATGGGTGGGGGGYDLEDDLKYLPLFGEGYSACLFTGGCS